MRLAGSLAKREGEPVQVFLIGDAAAAAKAGQPHRSSLDQLTDWTEWADKILVFWPGLASARGRAWKAR